MGYWLELYTLVPTEIQKPSNLGAAAFLSFLLSKSTGDMPYLEGISPQRSNVDTHMVTTIMAVSTMPAFV